MVVYNIQLHTYIIYIIYIIYNIYNVYYISCNIHNIYILYMLYIYGIHFELRCFRFHIESWPEWDLNPQPRSYCAHALTTELSGQMMKCA